MQRTFLFVVALALTAPGRVTHAEPVRVRHEEGAVHAFLKLSQLDGTLLASGDLVQESRGQRVTSRLIFRFKDGSLHDESTVFDQKGSFSVVSARLVQKGPAFPRDLDMGIDRQNGRVTVRYTENGESKTAEESLALPADLANGLMPVLLKNVDRASDQNWSMVAATPKPRLVKLRVSNVGEERLTISGTPRKAIRYVVHVSIGGIARLVAPLVGKQPPDSHVWILEGDAPAFVKSEGPVFTGGPVWRIELTSPAFPAQSQNRKPSLTSNSLLAPT